MEDMLRLLIVCAALSSLSACTLGYVPLVPQRHELEPQLDLSRSPGLEPVGGRLYLTLSLTTIPDEDWLMVQWFLGNREMASESRWVAPEDEGERLVMPLPDDIELQAGRWRAMVSFQGRVARQFSYDVPAEDGNEVE